MTLNEFENALHKLLNDAVNGGLAPDVVHEVADAIVNNTFLDDDCEDNGHPPQEDDPSLPDRKPAH